MCGTEATVGGLYTKITCVDKDLADLFGASAKTIKIVVPIVAVVVALLIIICVCYCICKRRR
jgi:hypothetical protein